ncbi:MAG TPA: Glu/Leu/Phe/Val dehydrogenase dimerization domain-containing protein [Rhodospirillales bacterium]|jgi:leucine dehydrogenase|nr:Glu/Leu/Phe/Val dehydrogenase dimerization domain-containing protein [Rhodospirillales bacterium]
MTVFSSRDFKNHELVAFGSDAATGLKCIAAVPSTQLGPALGGCRMWDYASDDEALADALRLSRGMTYKAAIAGLSVGGGKAVIMGHARRDKSEGLMRAFGRFVDSLGGRYITAEDVGTTVADMDIIATQTPFVRGTSGGSGNPSPMTALGVYMAIRAAVEHGLGSAELSGVRVAVQGLDSVGYALCPHLAWLAPFEWSRVNVSA